MPRVLIVAAAASEVAHVADEHDVLVTGIGKVAAATALARRLTSYDDLGDLLVVNLGTAGALHDERTGLYEIGTVINHEINAEAIRALGYDPRERLVVGESPTVLATGDVFVTDPVLRSRLGQVAHLVDMEGYAFAYVAAEFGVPIRMVKHVSDNADEGAMAWPDLVDRSARELAAWVEANLGQASPTV